MGFFFQQNDLPNTPKTTKTDHQTSSITYLNKYSNPYFWMKQKTTFRYESTPFSFLNGICFQKHHLLIIHWISNPQILPPSTPPTFHHPTSTAHVENAQRHGSVDFKKTTPAAGPAPVMRAAWGVMTGHESWHLLEDIRQTHLLIWRISPIFSEVFHRS